MSPAPMLEQADRGQRRWRMPWKMQKERRPKIEPGKIMEFADFILLWSLYIPSGQSGPQGNGSTRVPITFKVLKPVIRKIKKFTCRLWNTGRKIVVIARAEIGANVKAVRNWVPCQSGNWDFCSLLFYKGWVQFIWSNNSLECRFLPASLKGWKQTRSWLWTNV